MAHVQQPMHMSQGETMPGQQEQFYNPNGGAQDAGRTHTRFPQSNQRFAAGDGKRPGSA
jgi:hypothetical protein